MTHGPDPSATYFRRYEHRLPGPAAPLGRLREGLWHLLAGLAAGLGGNYLVWRWTQSLNPEAPVFSALVAAAETLCFLGTLLFFYDIWREGDTPPAPPPQSRAEAGLTGSGPIGVDVLITAYDEAQEVVAASVIDALALEAPDNTDIRVWLCDDGNRPDLAALAASAGVGYLTRPDNRGYKAGNLRNALLATRGDFIVICDADTRVLPGLVRNTLGYFRDPAVAWVQTPHWFYDIPEGTPWQTWLARRVGRGAVGLAPVLRWLSGRERVGADPFLTDPAIFFDVIQRRRNRHSASFCCGASSIHRREAVFRGALGNLGRDLAALGQRARLRPAGNPQQNMPGDADMAWLLPAIDLQPYRFHVSEDILTSIHLHADAAAGWRSVYHPQAESRMLSPRSIRAWAVQRLKYAGGTYDIMLRSNPLFRRGMNWRVKLHYAATFWSYLAALWMPVLLFAPAVSLAFAISPVLAYSGMFFAYFLPAAIASELAILAGCKGHAAHQGRILALASLPVQWRALISVLRGRRPRFPVTPKTAMRGGVVAYLWPNLVILAVLAGAAGIGLWRHAAGDPDMPLGALVVNLFWLAVNAVAVGWIIPAAAAADDDAAPVAQVTATPADPRNPESAHGIVPT